MSNKITIDLTDEQLDKILNSHKSIKKHSDPYTFSIAKAARIIGISKSTIHRRIKEGLIKTEIMGKSPRISQIEIDRFMGL